MLDIKLIRENPFLVKTNLEKRQSKEYLGVFDKLIVVDKETRELLKETEELRFKRNKITAEIQKGISSKKNVSDALKEAKLLPIQLKEKEQKLFLLKKEFEELLYKLPNLLHDSVPFGKDDSENKEIKKEGKIPVFDFELKHHGKLAVELNGADFERAVKISGTGFYFLKGELALLEHALRNLAIDILFKKGYLLVHPPFLMKRKPYSGVTDLND
ncbi:MAG: serine--tRNA ligase, partial [Candidatus Diapherotrites archaeon CG_4_10_14_0_2_um_filter_31_5]